MQHSGDADVTVQSLSTVSHELLNGKRKSSSLAGTARTAASGVVQQTALRDPRDRIHVRPAPALTIAFRRDHGFHPTMSLATIPSCGLARSARARDECSVAEAQVRPRAGQPPNAIVEAGARGGELVAESEAGAVRRESRGAYAESVRPRQRPGIPRGAQELGPHLSERRRRTRNSRFGLQVKGIAAVFRLFMPTSSWLLGLTCARVENSRCRQREHSPAVAVTAMIGGGRGRAFICPGLYTPPAGVGLGSMLTGRAGHEHGAVYAGATAARIDLQLFAARPPSTALNCRDRSWSPAGLP